MVVCGGLRVDHGTIVLRKGEMICKLGREIVDL